MKTNVNEMMKSTIIQASIKEMSSEIKKIEEIKKFYAMTSHTFSPLLGVLLYDDEKIQLMVNDEQFEFAYNQIDNISYSLDFRQRTTTNLPTIGTYIRLTIKVRDFGVFVLNTDSYEDTIKLYDVLKSHDVTLQDDIELYNNKTSLQYFLNDDKEGLAKKYQLKFPNRDIRF